MRSLRSVSGAIRQKTPDASVGSHFAESLLILGLEGSRPESYRLWVFKEQNGFRLRERDELAADKGGHGGTCSASVHEPDTLILLSLARIEIRDVLQ
jgi:hypothetical protein